MSDDKQTYGRRKLSIEEIEDVLRSIPTITVGQMNEVMEKAQAKLEFANMKRGAK